MFRGYFPTGLVDEIIINPIEMFCGLLLFPWLILALHIIPIVSIHHKLHLEYERTVLAPDGYNKTVITVNKLFPGPIIRATIGDSMSITVTHHLAVEEVLSLHFHGIRQYLTPWNDGAQYITNCAINFNQSYTYNFNITDIGTYWYHLHDASQRGEGGYGFIIVDDIVPYPGVPIDDELNIILTDWYHTSYRVIDTSINQFGTAGKNYWPGCGQAILVNGQAGGMTNNLYLDVKKDKIYRVRLLNAGQLAYFNLAIAGHNLTIIMQGQQYLQPVSMASLSLSAAERYDFLLNTSLPIANYRINIQTDYQGNDNLPSGLINNIFLRYDDSTVYSPLIPLNQTKQWTEQLNQFKSLETKMIENVTRELYFNISRSYVSVSDFTDIGFNTVGDYLWTINSASYIVPSTTLLLASYYQIMDQLPSYSRPLRIEYGEVIQMIFQQRAMLNGECSQHPWHLHGYKFWVIGYGPGEYNPLTDPQTFNLINPVEVDTIVSFPSNYSLLRGENCQLNPINYNKPCGWTAIRFIANNPGMWHLHCHLDWDTSSNMGIAIDVSTEMLWKNMSLRLPKETEFCGVITQNTPDPYASQAVSTGFSSSSSNMDMLDWENSSTLISDAIAFLIGIIIVVIAFYFGNRMKPVSSEDTSPKGSPHAISTQSPFSSDDVA